MRVLALITVAAIAFAAPSFAQQTYDRSGGTQAFVNMCLRSASHLSAPEPTCACGAGVISGRLNDRQYEIMRRFAPHTGNQPAMNAEIRAMVGEGYISGPPPAKRPVSPEEAALLKELDDAGAQKP